jgi:hypothetical protein
MDCGNLFQTGYIMRAIVIFTASVALFWGAPAGAQPEPKAGKKAPNPNTTGGATLTPAAERTRTRSLKAKMSVDFTDARLGDVLKEFAAQVDMKADVLLLWTYGPNFPYSQKVTYACKDKPLETALDELFRKDGLGYIVVSKEGDKHDGWILLTTTGERGTEKPEVKLTAAEEKDAGEKLALAKRLVELNKTDQAKTVLTFVLKKYPTAKVATEAKELLAKLEK